MGGGDCAILEFYQIIWYTHSPFVTPCVVPPLAAARSRSGVILIRHLKVTPFSLRLGHLRGKTVINCFLTLSGRFATYLGEGYLIFGGEGQGKDEAVWVGGGDVAGDDFTSMDEKVCVYLTVIVIVKQLIGIASDLFVLVF